MKEKCYELVCIQSKKDLVDNNLDWLLNNYPFELIEGVFFDKFPHVTKNIDTDNCKWFQCLFGVIVDKKYFTENIPVYVLNGKHYATIKDIEGCY